MKTLKLLKSISKNTFYLTTSWPMTQKERSNAGMCSTYLSMTASYNCPHSLKPFFTLQRGCVWIMHKEDWIFTNLHFIRSFYFSSFQNIWYSNMNFIIRNDYLNLNVYLKSFSSQQNFHSDLPLINKTHISFPTYFEELN